MSVEQPKMVRVNGKEYPEDEANFHRPRCEHPRYKPFFDMIMSGKKKAFISGSLRANTGQPPEFLDNPELPIVPGTEIWPLPTEQITRSVDPRYRMYFDLLRGGQLRTVVEKKLKEEQGLGPDFLDKPDEPYGKK